MTIEVSDGPPVEIFGGEDLAWLSRRQANVTSQFGEDGLIQAVFERIGITNEWCFEVGASDGLLYSNTKQWRDRGWYSILIESDPQLFVKLNSHADVRTVCVCEHVTAENFEGLLLEQDAPPDIDLGIIDVDGLDYWLFGSLKNIRPRVLLVEFGYWNPPDHIPGKTDGGTPDSAGKLALIRLGLSKGYTALCATYCNLLFVRSDCL